MPFCCTNPVIYCKVSYENCIINCEFTLDNNEIKRNSFIQYLDLEEEFEKWRAQMEEEISQKDKEVLELQERMKSLERPTMSDAYVQVGDKSTFAPLSMQSHYVPNNSFNVQPSSESASKLAQCSDNICKLPEEFKFNRILESSSLPSDFIPRVAKESINISDFTPRQLHMPYSMKDVNSTCKVEKPGPQWKTTEVGGKFTKDETIRPTEYDLMQNTLKLQNFQYLQNDAQSQMCCVNINMLRNLSMKVQAQERKKHQLQECFKQQQYQIENVLQRKVLYNLP